MFRVYRSRTIICRKIKKEKRTLVQVFTLTLGNGRLEVSAVKKCTESRTEWLLRTPLPQLAAAVSNSIFGWTYRLPFLLQAFRLLCSSVLQLFRRAGAKSLWIFRVSLRPAVHAVLESCVRFKHRLLAVYALDKSTSVLSFAWRSSPFVELSCIQQSGEASTFTSPLSLFCYLSTLFLARARHSRYSTL